MDEKKIQSIHRYIQVERSRGVTWEAAAAEVVDLMPWATEIAHDYLAHVREQGHRSRLLEIHGPALYGTEIGDHWEQVRQNDWYPGPVGDSGHWGRYVQHLRSQGKAELAEAVDAPSTKVVANLADPMVHGLKKKGLVLGYVQSGKTANYTAVMAKAADAGYRLVIVLAGMHNNLRKQTQERLDEELFGDVWAGLTTVNDDFGTPPTAVSLLGPEKAAVGAVVKKIAPRLTRLRDWLRDAPEDIRRQWPVLIIDDESDQATPNTSSPDEDPSRINHLIREIWDLVGRGTYLAYTATPFANVLMDPDDPSDLFPSDFLIALERPSAYYGAERVFGAGDPDEDGLDVVRLIPESEAEIIKETITGRGGGSCVTASLQTAVRWFILACAVRAARGDGHKHASMLVHLTHLKEPHRRIAEQVEQLLADFRLELREAGVVRFKEVWEAEAPRAAQEHDGEPERWSDVTAGLADALDEVRVIVDNSDSTERLSYSMKDDSGRVIPQKVIAVGGGTLSRGLTLEGLSVSYFTRTSKTYDTLLQMGRWFGFRKGYEDLQRVWVTGELAANYMFLAGVESDLRGEIEVLARHRRTPAEAGVRVRAHPGRLEITARNRMQHAERVRVGLGGSRIQTFNLPVTDHSALEHNLELTKDFLGELGRPEEVRPQRWLFRGVESESVARFVERMRFVKSMQTFRDKVPSQWIRENMGGPDWNVVLVGNQNAPEGRVITLKGIEVGLTVRSLVKDAPVEEGYIKALVSPGDWAVDIPVAHHKDLNVRKAKDLDELRVQYAEGKGLLLIQVVDKDSAPTMKDSRRRMEAAEHVVGIGMLFPRRGLQSETDFVSVRPTWDPVLLEREAATNDTEGSSTGGAS